MKSEVYSQIEQNALNLIPHGGSVMLGVGAPLRLFPKLPTGTSAVNEAGTIGAFSESIPTYMGDEELLKNASLNIGINNFFNFWTRKVTFDAVVLEALQLDQHFNLNVDQIGDRMFGGRGGSVAALKRSKMAIILPSLGRDSYCKDVEFKSYCLNECLPPEAQVFAVFPDGVEKLER